ncbi:MAG: P1 family peptidase [Ornithinimicrobium sp.]
MTHPGVTNSLVDVPGIRVGQYQRVGDGWLTGTTVVLTDERGAVGGVDVRGGGPGTRETDVLAPHNLIERVHAVCLCGGSAFGLAAADGVMRHRYAEGVGFPMGGPGQVVPIVPAAVIFDLGRGGEFGAFPDASFGEAAARAATSASPGLGNVGAGTGAKAGGLKGGVGSASDVLADGTTIAALVVVNAVGSPVDPSTGAFYGAPFLGPRDAVELGPKRQRDAAYPLALPSPEELNDSRLEAQRSPMGARGGKTLATTIGVIATDATLTKAQCTRLAGSGHDGMARAINPIHTMFDGDTLFALATGDREPPGHEGFHALLTASAHVVTRAIVRGILSAESVSTPAGSWRSYLDAFPSVRTGLVSGGPDVAP